MVKMLKSTPLRIMNKKRDVTLTPKYDLNIVPSCQISARKGQYGAPSSISGAISLAYSPVRMPEIGSPVTTRDEGADFGSNVTASSKSLM
jgi:hypothetical protein